MTKQQALFQRLARQFRATPFLITFPSFLYRTLLQPRYSIGVLGVVCNDEGHILLVEHVFHPHFPWGLPGGWIGRDETPENAVQRELKEELELEIEIERLLIVRRTYPRHLDFAFLCRACGPVGKLSFELLNYRWVAIEDLPYLYRFHYDAICAAFNLHET